MNVSVTVNRSGFLAFATHICGHSRRLINLNLSTGRHLKRICNLIMNDGTCAEITLRRIGGAAIHTVRDAGRRINQGIYFFGKVNVLTKEVTRITTIMPTRITGFYNRKIHLISGSLSIAEHTILRKVRRQQRQKNRGNMRTGQKRKHIFDISTCKCAGQLFRIGITQINRINRYTLILHTSRRTQRVICSLYRKRRIRGRLIIIRNVILVSITVRTSIGQKHHRRIIRIAKRIDTLTGPLHRNVRTGHILQVAILTAITVILFIVVLNIGFVNQLLRFFFRRRRQRALELMIQMVVVTDNTADVNQMLTHLRFYIAIRVDIVILAASRLFQTVLVQLHDSLQHGIRCGVHIIHTGTAHGSGLVQNQHDILALRSRTQNHFGLFFVIISLFQIQIPGILPVNLRLFIFDCILIHLEIGRIAVRNGHNGRMIRNGITGRTAGRRPANRRYSRRLIRRLFLRFLSNVLSRLFLFKREAVPAFLIQIENQVTACSAFCFVCKSQRRSIYRTRHRSERSHCRKQNCKNPIFPFLHLSTFFLRLCGAFCNAWSPA